MRWSLIGIVLTILLLASGRQTHAESNEAFTIFRVICVPTLDLFEIRQLDFEAIDTRAKAIDRKKEKVEKTYGLYSPEWYANLDVKPTNPAYGITPKTFECPLPAGLTELVVLPEPLFQEQSISITLRVAGRLIVDDLPFAVCRANGSIRRMTFHGNEQSLVFQGEFSALGADSTPLIDPFENTRRRFAVESTGIRTLDQRALGWTVRDRPLVHIDIDYLGSGYDASHFHQRGPYHGGCRYVGPGMPDSRWRDEDWEFRASALPVEDQGRSAAIVAAGPSRD